MTCKSERWIFIKCKTGDLKGSWPWQWWVIICRAKKNHHFPTSAARLSREGTPKCRAELRAELRAVEKSSGLQIEDNGSLCTALPVNDCLAIWAHWCMGTLGTLGTHLLSDTHDVGHSCTVHWTLEIRSYHYLSKYISLKMQFISQTNP